MVVDNGSEDDTEAVILSFVDKGPIHLLQEPVPGLSRSRNTGWRRAASLYVGFIDDDARAEPQWLEMALKCFETVRPQISALGGEIELDWESSEPNWISNELKKALSGLCLGKIPKFIHDHHYLVGANCFFTKQILEELGGFDVSLGRCEMALMSGEEIDLQQRIEATDKFVYYHPDVKVHHYVPSERARPKWFYRRFYWAGISDAVMRKVQNDSPHGGCKDRNEIIGAPGNSPIVRLSRNLLRSLSPQVSPYRKVHSRIYLSYCLGYLIGKVKYWKN